MERGSQWEEGLGLGLGVVEHGLHAVVRHCHQVRLLVSHRLEYGGAAEIHWNFDRFKGGDGGEEGACVCDQLSFRRSLLYGRPSPSKKAASQDAEQNILGIKRWSLKEH